MFTSPFILCKILAPSFFFIGGKNSWSRTFSWCADSENNTFFPVELTLQIVKMHGLSRNVIAFNLLPRPLTKRLTCDGGALCRVLHHQYCTSEHELPIIQPELGEKARSGPFSRSALGGWKASFLTSVSLWFWEILFACLKAQTPHRSPVTKSRSISLNIFFITSTSTTPLPWCWFQACWSFGLFSQSGISIFLVLTVLNLSSHRISAGDTLKLSP